MYSTAASHVQKDGVFLFDFLYGQAVLMNRRSTRIKGMEDETTSVTRFADPNHIQNENRIEVLYDLCIRENSSGKVQEVRETHTLCYRFLCEILEQLTAVGLSLVHQEERQGARI